MCGAVKPKLPDPFRKTTAREIGNVVAGTPTYRSPDQHLGKTVLAKKRAMREHARQEECDVALQHDEDENCVKSVLVQQVVDEVEVHENPGYSGPSSWGGFTTKTGHDACRTTDSAVDPKRIRPRPVRPCEEMTIKSTSRSFATRTISDAASPWTTSSSTSSPEQSSHSASLGSSRSAESSSCSVISAMGNGSVIPE